MCGCDLDVTGPLWVYTPASHKTEHHEHHCTVMIGPRAKEILKPWLRTETHAYLFSPAEAETVRNAERRAHRASPMTPSQAKRRPKRKRGRPPRDHYTTDTYRQAVEYGIKKNEFRDKEPEEKDTALAPTPTPAQRSHAHPKGVRLGRRPSGTRPPIGCSERTVCGDRRDESGRDYGARRLSSDSGYVVGLLASTAVMRSREIPFNTGQARLGLPATKTSHWTLARFNWWGKCV